MPNIVLPNTIINASNEKVHAIWKLTRGMLACGYRYRASADGCTKEAAGGDDSKDLWSVGGFINLTQVGGQTGTAASITAPLVVTGTTPPAMTLSGTLAAPFDFVIQITTLGARGTAVFKWSSDGGTTFTTGVTTAATNVLTATGVTANWPVGTYAVDNLYVLTTSTLTVTGTAGVTNGQTQGHCMTLSGAYLSTLNGTFRIASYVSSSSVTVYNPGGFGLATLTSTGLVDLANGSITWTEKNGGTAASCSAAVLGVVTVTGLTGMTTSAVGHRLTIINGGTAANNGTFLIMEYVSATSVKVWNPAGSAGDSNNGNFHWMERDPALDVYPYTLSGAFRLGAWINLQGPSTLKILIGTAAPAFTRGEKVTQAATGCEGEVLGIMTDVSGGTGFLVVAPRVNGTGGGPRGWSTGVITGALSGATVTPTTTIIEYIREFVFWKGSATSGHIYYQCIDQVAEATSAATTGRFSTMASLSQCTSQVCPGGSTGIPSANGFPLRGTLCALGSGGSGAATSGLVDFISATSVTAGMIQIITANNVEATNASQDGSWLVAVGTPTTNLAAFVTIGFQRVDDTEDGDVDPYVLFIPTATSVNARSRITGGTAEATGDRATGAFFAAAGSTSSPYVGFRRRGFATGDTYQEFSGWAHNLSGQSSSFIGTNSQNPETVACTFSTVPQRVREPIWIASAQINQKMRKGTLRWWYDLAGGSCTDTYDGKRWVQFTSLYSAANCAVVYGPWDGTTIPWQS